MTTTESHSPTEEKPTPAISRGTLRRAPQVLRKEGMRSFWVKLLGHTVYRRVVLVSADLTREQPNITCELPITVTSATLDDVDAYVEFGPKANAETFRRRLTAGSRVYVAWLEGRIVSAAWVDLNHAFLDAIDAITTLGPRDTYGRDSYTVPELRSRNIATVRSVVGMRMLREEGFERAIGYVVPENRGGFASIGKAGLDRIGSAGWFGVGPLRIYFHKRPGAKTRYLPRFRRGRKPVELDLDL